MTRLTVLLGLVVLCSCFAGCSRTQPTRFYTLSPLVAAPTAEARAEQLTIGVGPVTLPDYLDRPQIVDMLGPNEVHFAEFNRWAESPDAMLARVLGRNLADLLGTQLVVGYPWGSGVTPGAAVEVEILQFAGQPDGSAVLDARWRIRTPDSKGSVKRTTIEVPAEPGDYNAYAAACSQALGNLSREIADAITADIR